MSVTLIVTSSVLNVQAQKRFCTDDSVESVKNSLQSIVGTPPDDMIVQLKDSNGKLICSLTPNSVSLGFFPVANGLTLHVVDTNPSSDLAYLNDVSNVDKYVMPDEEYDKRRGTFREFKEKFLVKKKTPEEEAEDQQRKTQQLKEGEQVAATISVGLRCEVGSGTEFPKRGIVRFLGEVDFSDGIWVGVQFDEPYGKNNGSAKGKQYFSCPNKYGSFQRPQNVKVGDFPPMDEDSEDDLSDEL
eukprot:200455_1